MRLKTPTAEVQALLNEVLNDLLADHNLLITTYNQQSQALSNAIDNGNSLISSYQSTITVLTDSLSADQASIQNKQTNLQQTQGALSTETNRLNTLQQSYTQYVPNAQSDITNLAAAIAAIKTAIARMQSYQSGGVEQISLIQVSLNTKRDMKKVTDTLETMKETMSKKSSMYTPVVRELLDLTENMTQDKAQKVIDLLTQLLKLLQDTSDLLQTQLATYISTSNSQRVTAAQNIQIYQNTISQLTIDIASLQQQVKQTQESINAYQLLRFVTKDKLTADQAALKTLQNTYTVQDDR